MHQHTSGSRYISLMLSVKSDRFWHGYFNITNFLSALSCLSDYQMHVSDSHWNSLVLRVEKAICSVTCEQKDKNSYMLTSQDIVTAWHGREGLLTGERGSPGGAPGRHRSQTCAGRSRWSHACLSGWRACEGTGSLVRETVQLHAGQTWYRTGTVFTSLLTEHIKTFKPVSDLYE